MPRSESRPPDAATLQERVVDAARDLIENGWANWPTVHPEIRVPTIREVIPMESIHKGARVLVRDSRGREHEKVALSGVIAGRDIAVVWACRPSEWTAALAEDRDPDGVPWPAVDVWAAK